MMGGDDKTAGGCWRFWPVLLLACLLLPDLVGAAERETVRVRLKWLHQFQFAGLYAAIEQGYYREAGLDVQLQEAVPHESAVAAVLRGEVEYGIHGADLVAERAQGKPLVALAVTLQHSPLVLLSRRDRGVDHLHDLAGKRLLLGPDAAELLAYLRSEGVQPGQGLTRQSFDLQALIADEVDAMPGYSTDQPWLLERAGIPYNVFSPRAAGLDFYGDTLFTTETHLRQHPRQVRDFTAATLRGWQYALAHHDEMVELILHRYSTRHSREHLLFEAEQTQRLMAPELVEIGHMYEGRWRHIADSFAVLGMMPKDSSLDGFLPPVEQLPRLQRMGRWLLLSLLGTLAALALVGYFLWLNACLRRQVRQRRKVEKHLRTSEERSRALVELAPFPVLIIRLGDGFIRRINRRCEEHFAVRREEILDRPVLDFYANPADRAALLADVAAHGRVLDRELQLRTNTGELFWGLVSVVRIEYEKEAALFVTLNDISAHKQLEQELRHRSRTDMLTGLANRAYFLERLEAEVARARRHGHPLSILALDLDHFKLVNDTHGHAAGDTVLCQFSQILLDCLRSHDFAGRLGGEEFMVALPETDLVAAGQVAERIRRTVESAPISLASETEVGITVSLGVTDLDGAQELGTLLQKADQALYAAKLAGRNRVVVASPGVGTPEDMAAPRR
ncbi:MAG: hypothetical protein BWK76_14220 [Desulfobulbaceae bacterium A2]|nr:MAG: hypothetical protein BWK76_14220 [Desulfobulbaceae bacterium A2]